MFICRKNTKYCQKSKESREKTIENCRLTQKNEKKAVYASKPAE
jgi:hypothetical protein